LIRVAEGFADADLELSARLVELFGMAQLPRYAEGTEVVAAQGREGGGAGAAAPLHPVEGLFEVPLEELVQVMLTEELPLVDDAREIGGHGLFPR